MKKHKKTRLVESITMLLTSIFMLILVFIVILNTIVDNENSIFNKSGLNIKYYNNTKYLEIYNIYGDEAIITIQDNNKKDITSLNVGYTDKPIKLTLPNKEGNFYITINYKLKDYKIQIESRDTT